MAIFDKNKEKSEKSADSSKPTTDDKTQQSPEVAPPTHVAGEQTVDKAEDKVLPDSTEDEIAPIPEADGSAPVERKPAPSSTGYRVAHGKSVTATGGDTLDAGAEIGEQHVAGGKERIEALVEAGYVVAAEKKEPDDKTKKELARAEQDKQNALDKRDADERALNKQRDAHAATDPAKK